MTKTIQVQTGGKLYLAGEYAVLTVGQTALIQHIPIYMTAQIKPAAAMRLWSDMFDYSAGREPDAGYQLIQASVETFEHYLGQELEPFELSITGKMERDGLKFGIGSSGSVTVLTIKALAAYAEVHLSADQLFKLASYTLLKLGDNGSMGDIACISYADLVAYRSFDRREIAKLIETASLKEVLATDWNYQIDVIEPAVACDFLVGWTRQPAISKDMINQAKSAINQTFLSETEQEVQNIKKALQLGDACAVKAGLEHVSDLLISLSSAIYIDKLKALKEAAHGLDIVAKSSGSGGGDCGIALSFNPADSQELIKRWQNAGIELLYKERWGT
ncbi:phosphomevalonate kinase [Streptococcus dentiloxodontae]